MKNFFIILSLLLFVTAVVQAQSEYPYSDPFDSEDTRIEQAKTYAIEQSQVEPTSSVSFSARGISHPLFVGVDDVTVPAYVGDPVTDDWDSVFAGGEVYGAAYDNVNDKIYFNNGAELYEWQVGSSSFTLIGTMTDSSAATQTMVSLAFYNGVLYGTRNIANEAVYEINTTSLIVTPVIDYVDADYDFGGLAVDPTTGEFYGTNDDATPGGRGLYRINSDATATLIVGYPAGETDIDGLAISDSRVAYWIVDQPGSFYVYDLVAGTFGTALTSPFTTSEIFCGGTWNSGIIPVELTSFSASSSGSNVTLLWKTASELNNSGFSIERKTATTEFSEVSFVPGFGTTTERKSYSYIDENLNADIYTYRLKQIDFDGAFEYSSEVEVDVNIPAEFSLHQNFPNPFNPGTKITFSLAVDSKVSLKVYNILGQEVATLINQNMTAGIHNHNFDASSINSGVYFYKIEAVGVNGNEFVDIKKMILTK